MSPDRPSSLGYERPPSAGVSRWHFRLLLLLVLLNLAITVQTAYAPQFAAQVKKRWGDYQAARQTRAVNGQAFSFAEPASKVVWDDNPESATKLLVQPGYRAVAVRGADQYPALARWPKSARAEVPRLVDSFHRRHFRRRFPNLSGRRAHDEDATACLFLHRLKTPGGEDRLVLVYVAGFTNLYNMEIVRADGSTIPSSNRVPSMRPWSGTFNRELTVEAIPCRLVADGQRVEFLDADAASLLIHPSVKPVTSTAKARFTWAPPAGGEPEQIALTGGGHFRFYAGQPDPADPSRFTIAYAVDGRSGTIHGQLRTDHTIDLRPTTGRTVGSQWHFDADTPSAITDPSRNGGGAATAPAP